MFAEDYNEEVYDAQPRMSFVDDDINTEDRHVITSSMEDWELPNQVICLEI